MSTVTFEVVTPDRVVLTQDVNMVSLRGGDGELGILPKHMALATTVKPGIIRVKLPEGEDYVAVTGGFLEVLPHRITVLAETAEVASEIDVDRATSSKTRAEQRLAERTSEDEMRRAELALQRALNRLEVVELSARNGNILERMLTTRD